MIEWVRLLFVSALAAITDGGSSRPAYPEGFRHWDHVSSAVIGPGSQAYARFGGLHSIYANPAAAAALTGTGAFPDGAVLIFDVHHELSQGGTIVPGERRQVDVMAKENDGWEYYEFAGDSHRLVSVDPGAGRTQCAACHAGAPHDHVFSRWRD